MYLFLKIYWTTFSSTDGNVLKIVTNKNRATYPSAYGNMRSIKAQQIPKAQIDTCE